MIIDLDICNTKNIHKLITILFKATELLFEKEDNKKRQQTTCQRVWSSVNPPSAMLKMNWASEVCGLEEDDPSAPLLSTRTISTSAPDSFSFDFSLAISFALFKFLNK